MKNLKPCRFYFGDDPTYDGFTDGTTWNGFDNVWVTPEVHKQVMADHPNKSWQIILLRIPRMIIGTLNLMMMA
jgi:hypothetical protein